MLKTGFRGERKRILTPSLSQGEGECRDGESGGNMEEIWRKSGGKVEEILTLLKF